jgi:lipopolysaccharide export system permease protein
MGILSAYMIREILKLLFPVWLALGLLLFVLEWLAQVFNVKATAGVALLLYLCKIPSHLQLVFPVAVLFSCLVALGAMNRSREIVAAQSFGVSRRKLLMPVLVAVAIASLPYYWVTDHLAPWGMLKHYELLDTQVRQMPSRFSQVRQERIWYRNQDVLYNVGFFAADKNELYNVTIYTFDDDFHVVQTITASKATWNGTNWVLSNGSISLVDKRLETPLVEPFQTRSTRLIEDPRTLKRVEFNAETMGQAELWRSIARHRALGINTSQWEVLFHSRLTFYLISFIFVLLAFPRALRFSRTGGAAKDGVFVAATCMSYWLFFTFGANLGNAGRIHPLVAVWTPPIVFLIGVLVYNRAAKPQSD